MFFDVPIFILPVRAVPPPIVSTPLSGVDDSNELELTIGDATLVPVIPPEVEIDDTVANVPSKTVKPPHVMLPLPANIELLFVVIALQVKGLFIVTV